MNNFQFAITVLTLAIFITFASTGSVMNTSGSVVNTFSNNSIQGNTGGDGCAGCTPIGPGN
jgi:hypothetical protein